MAEINRLADHIIRLLGDIRDGIQVDKLEVGTKLSVETVNSIYELAIKESPNNSCVLVEISGGACRDGTTRYDTPIDGMFIGSTFGGSLLKLNWIGKNMCMEVAHPPQILTTSPVRNVIIEAADNSWAYSMDWNNEDQI
jgi:hypothetical protein